MNDEIRQIVNAKLAERDMNRTNLAKRLGMKGQYLSDILNGKVGRLSKSWSKILDELDLKLVAIPKK